MKYIPIQKSVVPVAKSVDINYFLESKKTKRKGLKTFQNLHYMVKLLVTNYLFSYRI